MISNPLMFAAISDFSGVTRGKAFPLKDMEKRFRQGVGWTPTNVQITCFDTIADSPFGSFGDLILVPDADTAVTLDLEDGGPVERFVLGDILGLDGVPWSCCTRSILKQALKRLEDVAGLRLVAAFEHEFQTRNKIAGPGEAFGLASFGKHRQFGEAVMAALDIAGVKPDTFLKEYGTDQFEVTNGPDLGVTAADTAVKVRAVTRLVGERMGQPVTFVPIRDPAGVGNGVHVHMSFVDENGAPATYDPDAPWGMAKKTASFIAGILKYMDSIVALTAPSAISYMRLTPHRWSAAFNNLGYHDREAAVRICPVTSASADSAARQYNFEYRAADATASPYLVLAALVHAGAQGIEEGLAAPEVTEEDLSELSPAALAERGFVRLPQSLEEALGRLCANDLVARWIGHEAVETYVKHKRGELAHTAALNETERCALYETVY
ncbi:glutamine synthetase family protein [Nitratireductor soli]|uniref:glutamine synthetase family protein n=1 Tax=Nitratireductor soli TaxID=1670619 RepID=UPI000B0B9CCE|nr:glutamine synthetase family protein [Nitratireductor soli]